MHDFRCPGEGQDFSVVQIVSDNSTRELGEKLRDVEDCRVPANLKLIEY